MKTQKQIIGKIGEDLACEYYLSKKHLIKDRNYLRKWGEIDVITLNKGKLFFIEVKTICRRYICNKEIDRYRAENNVHFYKTERIKRTIQTYLLNLRSHTEVDWQFDVVVVTLSDENMEMLDMTTIEDVIL